MIIQIIVGLLLVFLIYVGIDRFIGDADLKKVLMYGLLVIVVLMVIYVLTGHSLNGIVWR